MVQGLRIHLPMQGTRVRPLVGETEIPRAHAARLEKPDRLKDEPACLDEDAAPPKRNKSDQEEV